MPSYFVERHGARLVTAARTSVPWDRAQEPFRALPREAVRHIAFRDYLRAHPEATIAYEKEKRRARDLHPNDSHAYTDEKAAWVQDMEAKAVTWFAEQRDSAGVI